MILFILKKETDFLNNIVDDLKLYFESNGYLEEVKSVRNITVVKTLYEISNIRPDIMIYLRNGSKVCDININISNNCSEESKRLEKTVNKYLEEYCKYMNIDICRNEIVNCLIEIKPFPSIQLAIDNTFTNHSLIAKALYNSIIELYKIPKRDEHRIYKTNENINLRSSINNDSEFIVLVPKGTECEILQKDICYWKIKVKLKDKEYIGYCNQEYLGLCIK